MVITYISQLTLLFGRCSGPYQENEGDIWNGHRFEQVERESIMLLQSMRPIQVANIDGNRCFIMSIYLLYDCALTVILVTSIAFPTTVTLKLLSYIPTHVLNKTPNFCNCGLDKQVSDELCRFCSHDLRKKIKKSIDMGK